MARTSSTRSRLLAAAAVGAVAGMATSAVHAQDAPDAATVDDIIVTAQLRAQNPIDVPFALTAYDGEFLQSLGVQEFEELAAFVPGFLVQNQSPNNASFVMRGITSDDGAATVEPRVSVYQDGVSISKSRGSYVELFDIERMEIAKGPQSTLYGRGALIGAVNIVQRRAEPGEMQAEARVGVGDLNYRLAEGMVNLPLGDTAALRFATRLKTRAGYVDNLLGGEDYNAIDTEAHRLSFGWEPTDTLTLDLIANYQTDRASGTPFKSIVYAPINPATGAPLGSGRAPWDPAALTPGVNFDGGRPLGLDREVWGVTGLVSWDLAPGLTLNSTTAYRQFDSYEAFDADGVSLPILTAAEDAYGEQWSQELRLNFQASDRLSGFVGLGYFREEGHQRVPLQFDERIALAQLTGFLGAGPGGGLLPTAAYPAVAQQVLTGLLTQLMTPLGAGAYAPALAAGITPNLKADHTETSTNSSELTSWDLFGDLTFQATDRLELSAGLRYTRDDKTTGYASRVENGRTALGTLLAIQDGRESALPYLLRPITGGVLVPGFLTEPNYANRAGLPLYALQTQPTANNGDFVYRDNTDDGFAWRLTARYAVSDATNIYANYARGRRPEVQAAQEPRAPGGAPRFTVVEAETVDSVEVGAKTVTLDRRLRLDGAVFYYDYSNFQTTIQDGTSFVPTNAGEASSYGVEAQAFYAATPDLDLFATYGWNHSRFGGGLFEGNRFRLSPDHMASIGAIWRIAAGNGAFEVQPAYTWQSKIFFDNDNDRPELQVPPRNLVADLIQDEYQDAYGLVSLRVRYAPDNGAWGVEVFGDNLLDEQFVKDAGNTGDNLGMPTFIAGRGRTWGLNLSLRY